MDLMNYSTLRTLSRILTAAPQGRQVGAVLDKAHDWQATTSHTNSMLIPTLRYEVYESLKADAAALELRYGGCTGRQKPFYSRRFEGTHG